jgi:PAS domain S-box-containing protein
MNATAAEPLVAVLRQQRQLLLAFARELLGLQAPTDIAAHALRFAAQIAATPYARLATLDPVTSAWHAQAVLGWTPAEYAAETRGQDSTRDLASTARSGLIVAIEDLAATPDLRDEWQDSRGLRSALLAPLHDESQTLGALALYDTRPRDFSREVQEAVQFIAHVTAAALRYASALRRADRRQEDQASLQRELRLKSAALDATEDLVVITDLQGRVEYVNPAFERYTGFTRATVQGRRFAFLKSAESQPLIHHDIWETLATGRPWKGTVINDRADGSDYLEDQTITPVTNARGEIEHIVAIKRPVAHRAG